MYAQSASNNGKPVAGRVGATCSAKGWLSGKAPSPMRVWVTGMPVRATRSLTSSGQSRQPPPTYRTGLLAPMMASTMGSISCDMTATEVSESSTIWTSFLGKLVLCSTTYQDLARLPGGEFMSSGLPPWKASEAGAACSPRWPWAHPSLGLPAAAAHPLAHL